MALYEHIFVCRQDISPQQVETLTGEFATILKDNGGKIGKTEYWGLRNMAYRIRKNRKGHYSLMNIEAPHAALAEMERQMRLNDDIIRFMTIRVDEHDDEPSPPMQAKSRERPRETGRFGHSDNDALDETSQTDLETPDLTADDSSANIADMADSPDGENESEKAKTPETAQENTQENTQKTDDTP